MRVVNFYWYHVTQLTPDKEIQRYFKTRQDVAHYLGISVPQVTYYARRTARNPRKANDLSIIKLTSQTKVPVVRQEVVQEFVRPKVV